MHLTEMEENSVTYIFIHMEKKTGSKWKRAFEKGLIMGQLQNNVSKKQNCLECRFTSG